MRLTTLGLALSAISALAAPAGATITVTNYEMTGGSAASGTFSIRYDDTIPYDVNATIYTLTALDLMIGGAPYNLASSSITNISPGVIRLTGGNCAILCTDYGFTMQPALLSQSVNVTYHVLGIGGSATVPVSQVGAAVPEIETWWLMLLGFGAVGTAIRHAKRASRRAPLLTANESP